MALSTMVVGLAVGWSGAAQAPPVHKIKLQAKQFAWAPERIEIKAGETVELTLESLDEEHSFESAKLRVREVGFKKGEPGTVTFKAERAGNYPFKCGHYCGSGHRRMRGTIVVTE
ncbi:MAG TPA: cupredoxin domain-containing protein [Vicinamibacteria bacterium]